MTPIYYDDKIEQLFYNNWLHDLERFPGHAERLYGVNVEEIMEDPHKYYNMDLSNIRNTEPAPKPEKKREPKPELEVEGLF